MLVNRCKSRRLHHLSLTGSIVYGVVPGASSVRGRFPKEFFRGRDTPGASTVFFNKNNAFTLAFPSPPLTRRLPAGVAAKGEIQQMVTNVI
jgi:hypothetical protein